MIHSDQGRNFESAVFTAMWQLLEIAKPGLHHWTPSQTGWLKDSTVPLSLSCRNLWMQTNVTGIFMFRSYWWHTGHASVHDTYTTGCMYTGTINAGMRSTITNWLALGQAWRWSFTTCVCILLCWWFASLDGKSARSRVCSTASPAEKWSDERPLQFQRWRW